MHSITLRPSRRGFTLIELLVVMGILTVLASLLLPGLAAARRQARVTACLSNLRQVGVAVVVYSSDNDGTIPYGPKAGAFTSPLNFYPSTGAPTSLISLANGAPVGLGLLLRQELSAQSRVFFCPASDQPFDASLQLANVGVRQAQCSYYYRHAGNTQIFDVPDQNSASPPLKLDHLGNNRNNQPIRALVIDTQFLCPPGMATFGINPSTHHQQLSANILFADGHVLSRPNTAGRFTVDLNGGADLFSSFDKILKVLESADTEQ
jgi:prepilin-type N-terminal cleavage/methylation domain-containing protein/prepilin-type processing-associated H-X9-DG protein